jgi:hypothetical protein
MLYLGVHFYSTGLEGQYFMLVWHTDGGQVNKPNFEKREKIYAHKAKIYFNNQK